MTPIAFDGCFGWLHPAAPTSTASDCGVVMCGAIGFEQQVFHRSWRHLAGNFAAAGYPTLRFDYPGSGDSCGQDSDPGALAAWLRSIENGVDWLRANTGVRRIVLCGIHIGGLLAAASAARIGGIERLILLAPVTSGRLYARTLGLAAKIADAPTTEGHVEAYGLRLHETTLHALRAVDLARLPAAPAPKILILNPTGASGTDHAASALTAGGANVTLRDMPDYLALTRPAHESEIPVASFQTALTWLAASEKKRAVPATRPPARPIPVAELRLANAVEHPLLLGPEGARVFGMVCQPARTTIAADGTRTAVLICNTGANPHYGYGRLAVALARDLARHGIASVRIDVTGLGDSDGASAVSLDQLYVDRGADLRAATDLLQRRGYDRVVVFGICTGAFHAVHAALSDPRIAGVVLVNQIVYRWQENALLFRAELVARALLARLRGASATDAEHDAEQELLRLRISPPNPAKNKIRRIALRVGVIAENTLLRPFGLRTTLSFPARAFEALAARGVRSLIIAGRDDYARSLLQAQFGRNFAGLKRIGSARVEIEDNFDHPVGQFGARNRAIALVRNFVAELAPTVAHHAVTPPQAVPQKLPAHG